MSRVARVCLLGIMGLAASGHAAAQDSGGADAKALLKSACANQGTSDLTHRRLAQFILMEAGYAPLDALDDKRIPEGLDQTQKLIWLSNELGTQSEFEGREEQIRYTIENLEDYLARSAVEDAEPIVLKNPGLLASLPRYESGELKGITKNGWLFNTGVALEMRCGTKTGETGSALGAEKFEPAYRPVIAIRKKPEDFTVGGKNRLTADALTIGYEKKWDFDETTALQDTTTWTIDGAIGYRLSESKNAKTASYLFTRYQLERVRTDPLPVLEDGQTRDAKDKNVLEIGGLVDSQILDSKLDLYWIGSASFVANFVNENEKIRFRNQFEFGHADMKLPFCGFGYGRELGIGSLTGRCNFRIDTEGAIQTQLGTADQTDFDNYFGIGANATYEVFSELSEKQQIIFSLTGRYLQIIEGPAPDIWNIAISAKNRFWINNAIGFDIGMTFVDGRNELTLTEEKKLTIGFGIIM